MNKNVKMCDLIDLNSPDRKDFLSSRLASPLIPVPKDSPCRNYNNRVSEPSSLIVHKRDSLENNPFDMVLHKTTEYIQKKDDPFEVTLEKALRRKYNKKNTFRTCSLDYADKNILKKEGSNQFEKMNKTLDESFISEELYTKNLIEDQFSTDNTKVNTNDTKLLSAHIKCNNVDLFSNEDNYKVPTINVQELDISILNQSVMNDTLFETDKESNENHIKSSEDQMTSFVQKDKTMSDATSISISSLQLPKLRRSFSQGAKISPKKSQHLNQISLVESLRNGSENGSSVSSLNTFDMLNEGFVKSYRGSESSMFSSLSNVSAISKLNSVSSTTSSMILSNGTINRAFLESCSSEKSDIKETNSAVSIPEDQTANLINNTQFSMCDLTDRFNKLKTKASDLPITESSMYEKNEGTPNNSNGKECVTLMEPNEECNMSNKLIDVDVFTPEMNCSREQYKSSILDTSSDSVFLEENKINKSILHEAKILARTFEELALKTSSGSSIDDLLTSNPLWLSELLPAFEEEALIDNLIDLPSSPNVNDGTSKNEKVSRDDLNRNKKCDTSKVEENIQVLEMELIEPVSIEKRADTTTLLLELKKLIKTENNMEANNLLKDLEKVLGVNCENNTELLSTYFNTTNNLAKSPQKSGSSLEIIKNVSENNMEHSQEDNVISNSPENIKESFYAHMDYNNSNMSKCVTDNEKCQKEINNEFIAEVPDVNNSCENIAKGNDEDIHEKVAIDLLTNLGKLFSGQTEHSTMDLLKNLGKLLNFASANCNTDKEAKTDNSVENEQTPKKSKLKYDNKRHPSILSKSANRLSLDIESKKQPLSKNFIRRSISVSQTLPIKGISSPLLSKQKSSPQLREVRKRFPSEPVLVSPTLSKKIIANSYKADTGKDVRMKTVPTLELQKEKITMTNAVKNKLKKTVGMDIFNKKGPLKAILPIGTMQKKETASKKISSSAVTVTPPKTHKLISSTPNSSSNDAIMVKKCSRSSKPVASSTPDAHNSKTRKVELQVTNGSKPKRNFSCDISPVTTRVNGSYNNVVNSSPKRNTKLPSPKKTPKRSSVESNIPKSRTPPVHKRLNSSFDLNRYENRLAESPKRSPYKLADSQKSSPISMKRSSDNMPQSPLRDSNKLIHKVKPINLISKLRRNSVGTNPLEKENNYI